MARDASVTLAWADGDYTFRLGWGQLIELQELCDAGPFVILSRLAANQWRMQDISNTIRLGLIGGGTEPDKALKLVKTYVEARPPLETAALARGVLEIAVMGAPDEPPGKPLGEAPGETESGSPISPEAKSERPVSTPPAR